MRPFLVLVFAALVTGCASLSALMRPDPYLWMEEVEGERALAWVRQENARSLAQLESDSRYAGLLADATAIANSQDRLPTGAVRGGYYYNFWQDGTHVRGIWRRSPLADYARNAPRWETLLDIDALARAENANWVYKGVACAPSNQRCMVQLSDGGKDASIWREFDLATRQFTPNGFALPEAKSSLEWADENTLIVATNYGPDTLSTSGYPMVARLWRRGQPLSAAQEVMRAQSGDMGLFIGGFDDVEGERIVTAHQAHSFFEASQWRIDNGRASRFTLPRKATIRAVHKGHLIVTLEEPWTPQGASAGTAAYPTGALIAVALDSATGPSPATTLLYTPGARESLEDVVATRDAVLVAGYENVRGRILRFSFDGRAWLESGISLPPNGSVSFAGADSQEATAFAVYQNYTTPTSLYALDVQAARATVVRSLPAQFDASRFVAEQFEATSRDGTRVPYFVVRPRDMQLNGQNPTLLWAYGGFQISYPPTYNPYVGKLWLERGGVYVLANIRGGGEFGPAWHQAGLRTNRQVVFDDFIAVSEDLIARRITSSRYLGIQGGSNGGLLMGVMLTQRPELFRAVVVQVPLLDMLRYDRLLAGASWVDEYGSPDVPAERRWLEQMSPYQNLERREDFPVPFFVTSTKDDRVHPGHARKYAARMQELGMPFLYFENIDGGHAASANQNEVARRRALEMTYLMQRLMD